MPIKKILILFLLALLAGEFHSQVSTLSPYSRFGIGTLSERAPANRMGLARISSVWSDPYSINPENPATFSNLAKSTFQMDGSAQFLTLSTTEQSQDFNLTGLDNVLLAFKRDGGKAAYGLGLTKFSSSGYNSSDVQDLVNIGDVTYTYEGTGGVNKVYAGFSYIPFQIFRTNGLFEKPDTLNRSEGLKHKLSLGFNLEYYFGQINRIRSTQFDDLSFFNTKVTSSTYVKDISANFGLSGEFSLVEKYKSKNDLKNRLSLLIGATYVLGKDMNATIEGVTENFVNAGIEQILDTVSVIEGSTGSIYFPSKIGIGGGLKWTNNNNNEIFLLVDYKSRKWSEYKTDFNNVESTSDLFQNANELSLAFMFRPKQDFSIQKGIKLADYRFGVRMGDTYLKINGESISERAISAGISLPMRGSASYSRLNLGMEFGTRGTEDKNLVLESFTNVSVGFSFSPFWNYRWFQKVQYK